MHAAASSSKTFSMMIDNYTFAEKFKSFVERVREKKRKNILKRKNAYPPG